MFSTKPVFLAGQNARSQEKHRSGDDTKWLNIATLLYDGNITEKIQIKDFFLNQGFMFCSTDGPNPRLKAFVSRFCKEYKKKCFGVMKSLTLSPSNHSRPAVYSAYDGPTSCEITSLLLIFCCAALVTPSQLAALYLV